MIRRTVRSIIKWAMDDLRHTNYANSIKSAESEVGSSDGETNIRRSGMLFTVYPAEGGTVIQCRSNNYGESHLHAKNSAVAQPRLYVIHDDATFNNELANIIHLERVRSL